MLLLSTTCTFASICLWDPPTASKSSDHSICMSLRRYGMVANNGVPKPAYHAFKLLHEAGSERVQVTAGPYTNSTGVWAVRDDMTLSVFITNFDYYDFFGTFGVPEC
jgi:hypothetical protein